MASLRLRSNQIGKRSGTLRRRWVQLSAVPTARSTTPSPSAEKETNPNTNFHAKVHPQTGGEDHSTRAGRQSLRGRSLPQRARPAPDQIAAGRVWQARQAETQAATTTTPAVGQRRRNSGRNRIGRGREQPGQLV
uniref:(northern house mosquito) hypothetical protein n=1 Tax=Culex pipiens TaxID=7175 RepID=A0A8D8FF54_CULPI